MVDTAVKDKDRLSTNRQLKPPSGSPWQHTEAFIFYSGRAEKAENQTQELIFREVEFQRRLSSQPRQVCSVQVRVLVGNNGTLTLMALSALRPPK